MKKPIQFLAGVFTGLIAALSLKSYHKYQEDLQVAKQRIKNQAIPIQTKAGRIIYGTQGQGPPVLVIHGTGGGFDQAIYIANSFGQGFQWIAPSAGTLL